MSHRSTFQNETARGDALTADRGRGRRIMASALGALTLTAGLVGLNAGTSGAIVGGSTAPAGAHPWQVALIEDGEVVCGGSVLDARHIVTAAHCVEDTSPDELVVRAGVSRWFDTGGQDRATASIDIHPDYDWSSDIAVVALNTPLTLGGAVQAIAPASAAELGRATVATTSGWGVLGENAERTPDRLREAQVPLVDDRTCERQTGADGPIEVCAGGTGTDSCYGDSGGPLVIRNAAGQPRLAGVVSGGNRCGGRDPGIYTEIPAFTDWLANRTDAVDAPTDTGARGASASVDAGGEDAEGLVDWLDTMTDREFYAYLDDLSDAEFDRLTDLLDEHDYWY